MLRLDSFPTHEKDGIRYRRGHVYPFGAMIHSNGAVNFSIYSKDATSCDLLLYHTGEEEPFFRITLPEEFRIGLYFSIILPFEKIIWISHQAFTDADMSVDI